MSSTPRLDDIDLRLLDMLQENARVSQQELSAAVGLSSPAVGDRLRKLEERAIVRGFTAVLDPRRVGLDVTAFIFVGMAGSRFYPDFRARSLAHPAVLECHSVTGQGSHLLKIRTESTSTLEALLAEIQSWDGVQWTTTSIVLSTVKEGSRLWLGAGGRERADGGSRGTG